MRQIRISKRHSILASRKVPLNTVILPPLSPPLPEDLAENGTQLLGKVSGKVMVNKSNVNGDLVLPRTPEIAPRGAGDTTPKNPTDHARIAQLEQNIKFLQEQHQLMLAGLHTEVESLKTRNRELQFQLVFATGTLSSTPSSPEDDTKHKVYQSPKLFNTTPLQVEILEKELGEIKLQVQELESRNIYLSAIVDEQKRKLERYERDREKERDQRATSQSEEQADLVRKLEDAEAVIRRLRRENSDLRRENSSHYHRENSHHHHQREQNNGYQSPRGGNNHQGQGRGNRGHRSGNGGNGGGHYNNSRNWFPPLHSQSFWQGGRQQNDRSNGSASETTPSTALPNLQSSHENSNGQQYHGKKGSNNNHYHNNDGRKYRGGSKSGKPA